MNDHSSRYGTTPSFSRPGKKHTRARPISSRRRDERLAARKRLLESEKEFTRRRDALNAERRRLPMVEIDKRYAFEG
jgi:predicted dithiol-disulfide oxidoreductase (DUF899 family)